MTGKLHVCRLPVPNIHPSFVQNVLDPWSLPRTIHNRSVVPIDALHLLDERAHGMSAVACTGQRADDLMLMEAAFEPVNGEE